MISPTSFLEGGEGSTYYTYIYDYDIWSRRNRHTSIAPYVFAITITNTEQWIPLIMWNNPGGSDPFRRDTSRSTDSAEEDHLYAFVDDLL